MFISSVSKMAKNKEKPEKNKKNSRIKKTGRKKIRRIMKNVDLSSFTKIAVKDEQVRKLRVKQRNQMVSVRN